MARPAYTSQTRWFGVALVAFVLFNIAMPKGGFAAGGIPITNGYLVTSLLAAVGLVLVVVGGTIRHRNLLVLALMLPFQIWVVYTFYFFGLHPRWIGNAVGQILIFIAFPYMFFLGLSVYMEKGDTHLASKWFVYSLRFVTFYGLTLFVYYYFTKDVFEIPYFIVNLGDVGELYNKNNARGDFAKLFSTYNNGNIYGVCMCMLAPLYLSLDRSRAWKTLFLIATFLSLSRTVWVGIILVLAYEFIAMRLTWRKTAAGLAGLIVLLVAPTLLNLWFGFGDDFLFDADLGGRLTNLEGQVSIGLFPDEPIGDVKEIVYMTMIDTYGVAGLILFVLFMVAPIIVAWSTGALKTRNGRRLVVGMIVYLVLCVGDGAFVFPPTMTLYYFLGLAAVAKAFDGLADQRRAKRAYFAAQERYTAPQGIGAYARRGAISAQVMRSTNPFRS